MIGYLFRPCIIIVACFPAALLMNGAVALAQHDHDHRHDEIQEQTPERDPDRLWCSEHGVYEDECVICHPELAAKGADEDHEGHNHGHEHKDGVLWCNEHNLAETECGICQPQLAAGLAPGRSLKIRLPSAESAEKAGIRVAKPRADQISASFDVFCEAHYNQNQLARITPLVSGVIHSVRVDVGQSVSKGDLLVEIASAEVAAAKRDFLTALVTERLKRLAYDRETRLAEKEISAAQNLQQAEAEHEMARIATRCARQKLINFGFKEEEADEVAETGSSSSIVHVHAPFSGTLVERSAVVGEAVEPGSPLFTLADLSTMWLTLSIPQNKISLARIGLPVNATFDSLPGVVARGEITWIDSSVTEPSRMIAARALVANPGGTLRNNMFGKAQVLLSPAGAALTLPTSSVQRFEQQPFVFVKLQEDLYELRRVTMGSAGPNRVQIVDGLKGDEPVVVAGSYTMMSEFLKSRLGAGCVHD